MPVGCFFSTIVIRVSAVAARDRGSVFSLGSANAEVLATPLQTELHTFSLFILILRLQILIPVRSFINNLVVLKILMLVMNATLNPLPD